LDQTKQQYGKTHNIWKELNNSTLFLLKRYGNSTIFTRDIYKRQCE